MLYIILPIARHVTQMQLSYVNIRHVFSEILTCFGLDTSNNHNIQVRYLNFIFMYTILVYTMV